MGAVRKEIKGMPETPEQKARRDIDADLTAAGWLVQSLDDLDLTAGRGIAVREFQMKSGFGFADYLLYLDRKALGAVEAKAEGTLTGVEAQSAKYAAGLPDNLPAHQRPLPFLFESNGSVADRTVALMGGREDLRLEARLAFERLFVSAIIRLAGRDPTSYGRAAPRLPGRDLAGKALLAGEPLTRGNFLKGQAVNGPFGVIARLARQLELIDDDGRVGRNAATLLIAWTEDEQLPGVLDEDGPATRDGAAWMTDATRVTAACLGKREWPGGGHRIWEQLAQHLRPDQVGPKERRALLQILETASIRRRVFGLLQDHVDVFRDAGRSGDRGNVERTVLLRGIRPHLGNNQDDRLIADVIAAVDTYPPAWQSLKDSDPG